MSHDSPAANGAQPPSSDRVADALRDRILSGDLRPGAKLPTQHELAAEFDTNRTAVRQAIDALRREGLLTGTGRGAPPTVAERALAHDQPRIAGVELTDRIRAAFQAEHVTIDAFCLTSETLNSALAQQLIVLHGGAGAPRSITVRVLLPSLESHLGLPRLVRTPDDRRPLERLHQLALTFCRSLTYSLRALEEGGIVPEVSLGIRTVPITPTHKLYLLNGTEALLGFYKVVPRTVEYRGEPMEIYDVLGLEAPIFRHSRGPDSRDEQEAAFVAETRAWFDSLWSSIAQPLTLD
ncbi:MAG TPA: winged helix-turn-helix domain-containing protein [Streptomyces sp.]|uniref:winged helix-turn-helix domain-containing protein n=1 Tax=Streptomyces sp. TaxID=1931 RepID=UPI002D3FA812|nr:winged helix-turn-helix domain-containing protein [Streptomyces sp.]HZG02158.1 winged helix-turn-helix domain-containing protein [Streptomyces sp.]